MDKSEPIRIADAYPELARGPVPVEPYISEDYFEKEREAIFKKNWLNVCRLDDIPNPGDYVVKEIAVLRTSLLIVHGQDGAIRVFHNVCQHRGNHLMSDSKGCSKFFSCGFHGWVYDSQGKLVNVPDAEEFYDLDRDSLRLKQLRCEVWNGFVFFHPQAEPDQGLVEYLGELGELLKDYPFEQMRRVGAWRTHVKCNWKVFIDAFQEGYHVPIVHRNSLPDVYVAGDSSSCTLGGARLFDKHRALSTPAAMSRNPKPTEAMVLKLSSALTRDMDNADTLMPGINPTGMDEWAFDINVFYPNFFIDPANGWYFSYNFWPVSVNETYWEVNIHMMSPANLAIDVAQEYSKVLFRDALLEDSSTLERTQLGLESGAITHLTFSDQEIACRHLNHVVERDLQNAGV